MEKSLEVKIQFFAGQISARIMEIESALMLGLEGLEEKKLMAQSEILGEILERYETVFKDVLY